MAGQVLGQHRRFFSAPFVRCQAACLVSRMGHLGEGAREAAARRRVWSAQEERSRREGEAFHSAYIRGQGRALTVLDTRLQLPGGRSVGV